VQHGASSQHQQGHQQAQEVQHGVSSQQQQGHQQAQEVQHGASSQQQQQRLQQEKKPTFPVFHISPFHNQSHLIQAQIAPDASPSHCSPLVLR
jgi:chromosomal replication initiation ATPase DnaA